jgi:ABC-type protease/lipase transport system fused ATPase/permease subunit
MNNKLRHTVRNLVVEQLTKKQTIKEQIEPKDYQELRDFIRAEVALIFFDFFKKRNMWI